MHSTTPVTYLCQRVWHFDFWEFGEESADCKVCYGLAMYKSLSFSWMRRAGDGTGMSSPL